MSDFPQMIFHIIEPQRVVNDKEELQYYIDRGWSMTSVEFDEIKMVKTKISHHEAEAQRLKAILVKMDISAESFICDDCGYEAGSNAGLSAHKRHKHKEIEVA